jgi:hypothetical protein
MMGPAKEGDGNLYRGEGEEEAEEVMMGPAKEGDGNLYRGEGEEEAEEKKSPTDGQEEEREEEREHGYSRILSM